MSLIQISNLTFVYPGSSDNIFQNVSFQIDTDWKLGFIGRNGRGNTTFLNLLMGCFDYQGSISSSVKFFYFPFIVPERTKLTADIISNIATDSQNWELVRELSYLEVPEEVLFRPFETLSSGEQTKVLLAALFLWKDGFLLIDEPTNHLDLAARQLVSRYLNRKKSFILVSHDRCFLDSCVDHVLSINKTNIEIQKGSFSSWWENKLRQDCFELAKNEKLKKEVSRLSEAAKRTSSWSDHLEETKYHTKNAGLRPDRGYIGHKAAKMMSRSKSIENRKRTAAAEKADLLKNIERVETLKLSSLSYHKDRLLSLRDLSIHYGDHVACNNVSFTVNQGERIALCGKNGSGKSSLLKLICGEDLTYSGEFQHGENLVISFVPQDTSFLMGNLSDFAATHHLDESLFKTILRKLDFSREQFEKNMEEFSSGQKKKVLLARSLCQRAHLYVWDEPLNYVDIFSRMQIEKLLLSYPFTFLFVEHDSSFLETVATKIIQL